MQSQQYQSQELQNFLVSQLEQNISGELALETRVDSWQTQRIGRLVINNGALVYGDSKIPNNLQLARTFGNKFKSKSIDSALTVARNKLTNPKSVRELIKILVKLRVFKWEQIEANIHNQVVLMLEKFVTYPGQAIWHDSTDFDLCFGEDCHGLNWIQLKQDLNLRQKQWTSLAPQISSMDAVPYVGQSNKLKLGFLRGSDPRIGEHFDTYVDGRRTLVDIATVMDKDPLIVANFYFNWVNSGIVSFKNISEANNQAGTIASGTSDTNLPKVLSVDDSPIVQLSIKRALTGHCNLLCSNQPINALSILRQHSVELLLLDLTMPGIDGLDFCKMIRNIPKFKNLPIVMLTARDGFINKMKGQIAGTNEYLTKPFTPEELVAVVNKYIKVRQA